jgi:hypothetical protein
MQLDNRDSTPPPTNFFKLSHLQQNPLLDESPLLNHGPP